MKRKCTLLITHACNLNCVYCYERHKSAERMPAETARRIFETQIAEVSSSERYVGVDFHFLGGEPLLNFEVIREVCEWAWSREWPVPFHFYVITNGTLLDEAKRDWFELHKRLITVDMSIDGLDATHRVNRGCSVGELPVEWVHRCWPHARFKMTVSRQTLRDFADGVIALVEQGYDLSATPAMGEQWSDDDVATYDAQWQRIADHFLAHRKNGLWRQLLKSIDPLFDERYVQEKCCGSGDTAVTYDVDGALYPCVIFSPMVFGRDIREELSGIRFDRAELFADQACADCFIRNMCKTCYGFNLKERGALAVRDKSICGIYRAEIRAICRFQRDLLRSITDREFTAPERERLERAEAGYAALLEK